MKQLVMGMIVGIALCAGPSRATAQNRSCADDVKKLCADVKGGGGRILKCLKVHQAELSAECKTQLQGLKGERAKRWQACRADTDKLCKDTHGGARMRCLQEHQTELSPDCKAQIQRPPQQKTP